MNRSQVRKLAREYASGRLPRDDYLRRRATLIDGIVDGDVPIEREEPPASPPPPPRESAADRASVEPPPPVGTSPVHMGVGVAVTVLVLGLGWALWPEPVPSPPRVANPVAAPPVPRVSGARTLVEQFVAGRDWSEAGIERFESRWGALPDAERADALGAAWFRRLPRAIRDEMKTQQALLEFDQADRAARTARRLLAFADRLGVGEQMPDLDLPGSGEPSAAAADEPPAPTPTASAWLAAREDGHVTLQLFAVDHLDKVAALIEAHHDVEFMVLESSGGAPRYHVVHGDFADASAAREAHGALPVALRAAHPSPFIETFGDLRAALRGEGATRPPARAPSPVPGVPERSWVARQPRDHYTLQLFASSSRDNVDRLVTGHLDLGLQVHTTSNERSRFRVLFGVFDDESSARAAVTSLPQSVLNDIGKPLVKSFSELRDIESP